MNFLGLHVINFKLLKRLLFHLGKKGILWPLSTEVIQKTFYGKLRSQLASRLNQPPGSGIDYLL